MKITTEISDKRIRQLIEGAGSGYWAKDFEWVSKLSITFKLTEFEDGPEYTYTITREAIALGLQKMAAAERSEGGHHFADCLDNGEDDMWTGDALIQFAVFGELKYG